MNDLSFVTGEADAGLRDRLDEELNGKPLKLGLEGLHSARRGDYRVIYRIDDHR